jgi:hypothetical protein
MSAKNFVSQDEELPQKKKKKKQIVRRSSEDTHLSVEFQVIPYVFIFIS